MQLPEPLRRGLSDAPKPRDGLIIAGLGLVVRLMVVLWAATDFPPAEDGRFYDIVARRIAEGHGYTWLWPDGAVTYAAHYPVGYPAFVGALYAVFGPHPAAAMAAQAVLGALSVYAAHAVAAERASRAGAVLAGSLVALHPALVFYTPALMTEGLSAAVVTVAAWLVVRGRRDPSRAWHRVVALGLLLGLATLLRPQLLLLAPVFGLLLAGPGTALRRRIGSAVLTLAVAVAVCLPWTLRNCARMERCVFVSANGGWNLLIGAAEGAAGSWVPIERAGLPRECRTVFAEAEKDACFGRAALERIRAEPVAWVELAPAKLSATFDYVGAAAWYLHTSNPAAIDDAEKFELGLAETSFQRLILLLALLGAAAADGPRRRVRWAVALLSMPWLVLEAAWVAHLGLLLAAALLGRRLLEQAPLALAAWVLGTTALTHIVFFGAGRYAIVAFGVLAALAGTALARKTPAGPARL